jgi:hypothetical protein
MSGTRKTLVDAKSQQRPEERWFVIGWPSRGILMLKIWVSVRRVGWFRRRVVKGVVARVVIARRFFGS